jgi:hypothetical protein
MTVDVDLDRLLDILMPSERGVIAMLEAYFDESQREGGIFCVAGYAFAKPQAKKFCKEWTALFGPKGCRMSELSLRTKRFKGIDQTEADRLGKGAVAIINRRISFAVAVSCDLSELAQVLPRFIVGEKGYYIDGMQNAYPFCCHLSMALLGGLVQKSNSDDGIAYVFESGHKFAPAAHRFMGLTDRSNELKEYYSHRSHAFVPKSDAVPLQAADMLAWEWAKFMDETVITGKRHMRASLKALLAPTGTLDPTRRVGKHVTGAPLRRFMAQATQLGILQVQEQSAAKESK